MRSRRTATIVVASAILIFISGVYVITSSILEGTSNTYIPSGEYKYRDAAASLGGLILSVSVNSTQLKTGATLSMAVHEYDPSNVHVNESAAANWKTRNIGIGFGCAFQNLPLSASVFKGYYSIDNLSQAVPLQLVDLQNLGACPPLWTIQNWVFEPLSDNVQLVGCLRSACVTTGNLVSTRQAFSVGGTWPSSPGSVGFTPFKPGIYTVAAGDEWGAVAIVHFIVTQ
jgi:hypothetical protein